MKLRELEEEEAHQLAETEAVNMGGGDDDSDLDEKEEADVQEIRKKKWTMRNVGVGRSSNSRYGAVVVLYGFMRL